MDVARIAILVAICAVSYATVVIGTVVLNEAVGPFFLKSALTDVGETKPDKELLH